MTPSWYDVLGVEPDASAEEIRAAWQEAVAHLDPTERRFKAANRAAEALLDPQRRAAHDADLAADLADEDPEVPDDADATVEEVGLTGAAPTAPATIFDDEGPGEPAVEVRYPTIRSAAPTKQTDEHRDERWVAIAAIAASALAVVLLAITVLGVVHTRDEPTVRGEDSSAVSGRDVEDAREAAVTAIGPLLAYDYRHLDADRAAALPYMADTQRAEYEKYFDEVIVPNAPRTKTVVTVKVVDSAIALTGPDLVDVLLFVNRPTSNKQNPVGKEIVYHDQVTARMQKVGGVWLVGCLITTGGDACGD